LLPLDELGRHVLQCLAEDALLLHVVVREHLKELLTSSINVTAQKPIPQLCSPLQHGIGQVDCKAEGLVDEAPDVAETPANATEAKVEAAEAGVGSFVTVLEESSTTAMWERAASSESLMSSSPEGTTTPRAQPRVANMRDR